jgi:outer membrane immunogenic protein
MHKFIVAALLAGTAAAPALAQTDAPFTGFRVEGIVGYESVGIGEAGDSEGVTYGIGAGYDFQLGGAVAGVEAEISDNNVDECETDIDVIGDEICAQSGRDIYVGGRLGAVVGTNTLLYAKAGYVNGRVQVEYDDGTAAGLDSFEESATLDGVRVGAGLEHSFGGQAFVKAEYRYSNYEAGVDKHQGVVGVGYRF